MLRLKCPLVTWSLFFGTLLLAASPAKAETGGLQTDSIPADARWLVHLNLHHLRGVDGFPEAYQRRLRQQPFVRSLEEGRWKIKLNFDMELEGITLFGKCGAKCETAILLFYPSADAPRNLPKIPGEKIVEYFGHQIYTWSWPEAQAGPQSDKPNMQSLAVVLPASGPAIWGSSLEIVKSALDVLDKRADSLAESDSVLNATAAPSGSLFVVRASQLQASESKLDSSDDSPSKADADAQPAVDVLNSLPLFDRFESLSYAEGIHEDDWFSSWTAVTNSQRTSQNLKALVEGVMAAYWLFAEDPKNTSRTSEPRLEVSVNGRAVRVRLDADVALVSSGLDAAWSWIAGPSPSTPPESTANP